MACRRTALWLIGHLGIIFIDILTNHFYRFIKYVFEFTVCKIVAIYLGLCVLKYPHFFSISIKLQCGNYICMICMNLNSSDVLKTIEIVYRKPLDDLH